MKNILLLLLLTFFVALSIAQQTCNEVNAIYEQKLGNHYKQFPHAFEIINDNSVLAIQYFEDADPKTIQTVVKGTSLSRVVIPNRQENTMIMQQIFFDKRAEKDQSPPVLETDQTRIFSLSNIVGVNFGKETQQRSLVSFLLPRGDNPALSTVRFTAINANIPPGPKKNDKPTPSISKLGNDTTILFQFPLAGDVYNQDGEIIRPQVLSDDTSSVSTNGHPRGPETVFSASAFAPAEGTTNLDFVVLALTQGSLKLIKYTASQVADSPSISALASTPLIVVPAVEVTDGDANFTLGGQVTIQGGDILVLTHLHLNQIKAFNKLSGLTVSLTEGQVLAPVLIKISADLKFLSAVNLAPANIKASFASSMEVRDNSVVVAMNTYRYTSILGAPDRQRPIVAKVSYNKDTKGVEVVQSFVVEVLEPPKPPAIDYKKFYGIAISFAIDGDTSKFVLGGAVADWKNAPYEQSGLAALILIEPTNGTKVLYRIDVGESGANAVELIRRAKRTLSTESVELHIFGNSMDGPTNPPPADETKDPYRSVKVGFWQADCKPRNMQLEAAVTYIFYAFFGIVCIVFAIVVVGYTAKGVALFIRDKRTTSAEYSEIKE